MEDRIFQARGRSHVFACAFTQLYFQGWYIHGVGVTRLIQYICCHVFRSSAAANLSFRCLVVSIAGRTALFLGAHRERRRRVGNSLTYSDFFRRMLVTRCTSLWGQPANRQAAARHDVLLINHRQRLVLPRKDGGVLWGARFYYSVHRLNRSTHPARRCKDARSALER